MREIKKHLLVIVQIGLLMGLALAVRFAFAPIIFVGATQVRLNFFNIFSQMIPILFGPALGAVSGGLIDVLGFLTYPQGGYIPAMTVVAIVNGGLTGMLWTIAGKLFRNKLNFLKMLIAILITDIIVTAINTWVLILFVPTMNNEVFILALAPRLLIAIPMAVLKSYIVSIMYNLYNKHIRGAGK